MTNRMLKMIVLLLLFALRLAFCQKAGKAAEKYVDYLDMSNWAYYGIGEDKPVDVFLICPTVDTKDEYNMSMDDEKIKERFVGALNMERGLYEDTARVFALYYPLNWKTDSTPADKSENFGACFTVYDGSIKTGDKGTLRLLYRP